MAIDPRIREMIKQMLVKAVSQKVEPNLKIEKPDLDVTLLSRAAIKVQQKVAKILDSVNEFNPELLLSKIPSLEFLELLVVSEYLYLYSIEYDSKGAIFHGDPDVVAAFTKILNAYDIQTPTELEQYRELWREIWNASRRINSDADKAFEKLKEALVSSGSSHYRHLSAASK